MKTCVNMHSLNVGEGFNFTGQIEQHFISVSYGSSGSSKSRQSTKDFMYGIIVKKNKKTTVVALQNIQYGYTFPNGLHGRPVHTNTYRLFNIHVDSRLSVSPNEFINEKQFTYEGVSEIVK